MTTANPLKHVTPELAYMYGRSAGTIRDTTGHIAYCPKAIRQDPCLLACYRQGAEDRPSPHDGGHRR